MTFARKAASAVTMLRTKGWGEAAALARIRAGELLVSRRPVPGAAAERARLVETILNRRSLVAAASLDAADFEGVRREVIALYVRHRFAEAARAVAALADPRPVEILIQADGLLSTWDFRAIAAAAPAWRRALAGTGFEARIEGTQRRAALRLGRLQDAASGLDEVGNDLGSLVLRGDILDALGRMGEARAAYEAAVRLDGSDPDARQSYGFHLLKAGRVRDGLASWSAADALFGTYPLRRHRPQWAGSPLGRRRLMVLFEHGLGDMIQVARFLPRLIEREPHATVLGRIPAPLLGLMSRAFPRVRFVTEDEREPDYDLFVPSMQLAAVLGDADLMPQTRYVALGPPAPTRAVGRLRVGVCWRGHPREYDLTRSVPLDVLWPLLAERDVDFVVLLHRLTTEEAARLAPERHVAMPPIRDFVDLASVVASCDLVVSVDTAVVHLAGAGGVPTILLSRPDSCWRWGTSGDRGPWYDSVEVLRHGGDMDWPTLVAAARERIRARALVAA